MHQAKISAFTKCNQNDIFWLQMKSDMNMMQTIREQVGAMPDGSIFTMRDFYGITAPNNTKQCISRLVREGVLNRVCKGIYQKPRYIKILDTYASADPQLVAEALVRENGWSIAPSGNAALNILGLDTQVPMRSVYVSSGPNRKYEWGKMSIEFQHRSSKEVGPFSEITALIIQALKALGPENIQDWQIRRLQGQLTEKDRETIRNESRFTFAWMQPYLESLVKKKDG